MIDLLLVLNPQNSYLSPKGSLYMGDKSDFLRMRLIDYLKGFKGKKIFLREKHAVDDAFFRRQKTHSIVNTEDFHIHESLRAYASLIIDKVRYSAFYQTDLYKELIIEKVKNVGVVGLETHTSVLYTVEELCNRGYEVSIVEPLVMSVDDTLHRYAITLMDNSLGIHITNF